MKKFPLFNFRLSIIIILFSFSSAFLFARDLTVGEERALSYIRELVFDITRFNASSLSLLPESQSLAEISKTASNLCMQQKTSPCSEKSGFSILPAIEYYNPKKIGIIASSFCPEDLYSITSEKLDALQDASGEKNESPVDWIDLLLQGLDAYFSPLKTDSFDLQDGTKILEMLENGDGRGIDGLEETKIAEELPQEFVYLKSDGDLRLFSYDGEQFTAWKEGNDTLLVNFYGEKLIRKRFDSLFRLVKNERFKFSGSAKNISLENKIEYNYADENTKPVKSVENMLVQKKRVENHYDENGRCVFLLESHYEDREIKGKDKKNDENPENPEKETVLLDDKKTTRVYDENGRLSEEETLFWTYKKALSGKYSRQQRSVKNVFDYSSVTEENKLPPNLKFYEDSVLHLERKYTSANAYSEKVYFEDGFSVEVLYEAGVKKAEIIYINGIEQRRRDFEY